MAEAMTSATAELLISKIVSAIEHEASLLGGLSAEFDDIKNELISMRSFLEDADKKAALAHGESTWVASIRDLAYEVEDAMDEFMYHMNKQQNGGKFTWFLHQTIFLPKITRAKHQIAMKIQNIKIKIKAIDERRRRYGIERIEGTSSSDDKNTVKTYAEASLFIEEEKLVGIKDDKEQLVKWLTEEESERTVISVVGMGGLGKTTLVARAYNSSIVKRHFDCYAWITVSQKYVVDELLKRMIEEFYSSTKEVVPTNLNTMTYRELVDTLVNYLGTKRYMLVLDDIWSSMLWQEINVSLPDKGFGSRVMLTTRGENIASSSFGVRSHVHHLKSLGEDEAWELFSMKAFMNNLDRHCPPELEIIARNLIKKCEGLPLAIVALGGAMSSKTLESEWKRVNDNLDFELSSDPQVQKMKLILLLSFNEMPYQLKLCFLYCCLFPEDHEIRRKRLIRLWMAEGFVEKAKGIIPEEVAESFLMQLIHRNVLQVVERNATGRPKVCKMHDLLREIALSLSETQKFGAIMNDVPEAFEECRARRLSIQIMEAQIKSLEGMSQLRSLLVFGPCRSLQLFPSRLRWLRVLDLQDIPITKLPDELVDMFNLRYLSLKNTLVRKLPKSIGRLRNLETLILRYPAIKVIPTGITKLQNLRHLITNDDFLGSTTVPSNIWKLENLQVLDRVKAKPNLMRGLKNMTQLTKLGMTEVREVYEQDLCTTIENMNLLRHLYLAAPYGEEFLRMDKLSSALPCLKTMELVGRLVMVPRWFNSLPRLTKLRLRWSQLTEDLLPFIQALPCLTKLSLINACSGTKLHFTEGFHKLKTLHLEYLHQLNEITIDRGVMPGLRLMSLFECDELKKLPQGIEHLANLEELNLGYLPTEINDRLNEAESVERLKVRHIPKVSLRYRSTEGEYKNQILS